jgi:hypothetical protein
MAERRRLFGDTSSPRHHAPHIDPDHAPRIAEKAQEDAMDLAMAVRDLGPSDVWGRLHQCAGEDPVRLVAACVALAAMVPVDTSVSELLAWLEPFQGIRGVVA